MTNDEARIQVLDNHNGELQRNTGVQFQELFEGNPEHT